MKCTKCQFENPENAKFCIECGAPMEFHCPQCGAITLVTGKFCMECGHNLARPAEIRTADISFDEKIRKIQKYLPEGITEKILSQKDRIEGERKHVTVMFCDMQGSTALSERLGPEAAYTIMDEIYEILIHKVHDYEGTVNEMTGDGIMALFGAPIALEDAPQRAIRSSLAVHREMAKFSDRLKQEMEIPAPIKMRIGIHTGPVVVGTIGNDLRVEFKAVGDTVNLASRIESLAEPGTTYVTGKTYKLTEGFFLFEALGKKDIKGIKESVSTYQVLGPSSKRTRFDVSAESGLTRFVGRGRELELLLDSFERAKSGRGQAVSIVAEAGVGKSRLLYEFRKAVSSENALFLEGRCMSYSRSVAFYPIIDILKANFDIGENDADMEIKAKVKKGIKIVGAEEATTLPYLLDLFSVKDSSIDKFSLSPEEKKDRMIEAAKRIALKGSEIRPLILAYEDLHWMDKSSEELLKSFLEDIPGARIVLLFTYRPEFVHTWGAKSFHSHVTLNRLSNRESISMAAHLLGTEKIDRNLENLILEKAEGIPFFIEELLKSLKTLKLIDRKKKTYCLAKDIKEVAIPSTIQDVIMSRVDSMSEGAKEVIQIGSVIEREFGYEIIKSVSGLEEKNLLSCLSALKDSELLYERGIFPDTNYIFKHALTREVVYDSILTERKKKLHAEIGHTIEEVFRDNIVEHYEILAEHYITSENFEKGAQFSRLAGKKAGKTASFVDALAYGHKGISCLEKLPLTADVQKKIIDARTILGLYFSQLGRFAEAKRAINPIVDTALKSDYQKRVSQIHTIIGFHSCFIEDDISTALNHLEKALRKSEKIDHIMSIFFSSYWLSLALWLNCEFQKAIHYIQKALEINIASNIHWGIVAMKSQLSSYYSDQGNVNMAYQTSREAVQLAEESGDIYSKSFSFTFHGISCYSKGFFDEALDSLLKATKLSERLNFREGHIRGHACLGHLYYDIGEYQNSIYHYNEAISIGQYAEKALSEITSYKTGLARAKLMNNQKDIDQESLSDNASVSKLKLYAGQKQRFMGELFLNSDNQHLSDAEKWIERAIEADKRNGMMWQLARDYASKAEVSEQQGHQSKAIDELNTAIEIFKECGADGWVEKYKKELQRF